MVRYAPLILIPASLERASAAARFRLRVEKAKVKETVKNVGNSLKKVEASLEK
ncbi:DUF4011 domain-containing protein [Rhizobium leguminosarum]|uniref:DUF4011 domain-containing protein n=1 Tax=Rhizobium leguminosarum TaxID=384 RepID=UPI0024A9E584|nr:DUF4011 domain-containing protein [Rhizobium leguminosarum]MDI5929509.1 DUF4011 domain-containing protein [Rhizobium leguminosarum]